jgi:hypothetical protein
VATFASSTSRNIHVFRDGAYVTGSDTASKTFPSGPNRVIWGSFLGSGGRSSYLNGDIGASMLWNRALSAGEAADLYHRPWALYRPSARRGLGRPLPRLTADAASLVAGSTGNTVNLTGVNTAWTAGTPGSPTFGLSSTGSGAAITAQVVTSATGATLTIDAGSAGTITISDPDNGTAATIAVGSGVAFRDRNIPRGVSRGLLAA